MTGLLVASASWPYVLTVVGVVALVVPALMAALLLLDRRVR